MDSTKNLPSPKTEAGKAWLKAYLHPPSGGEDVQGIPDHSVQSSVTSNWKNEFSVDAPSGTGTGTWSCLLISAPNPQTPLIALKWVGDLPAKVEDISGSLYENPNFSWGVNAKSWDENCSQFRPYSGSMTTYFDASDLYNQGKVYVSQGAIQGNLSTKMGELNAVVPISQDVDLGLLPMTASTVMQMSDRYYSGMAKEGSYSVQGFVNPTMNYFTAQPTSGTVKCKYTLSDGTTPTASLNVPAGLRVPTYPGVSVSYHLYKGLLAQATLQCKRIHGWEMIPPAGSGWAQFSTNGPCPDAIALENAALLRFEGRDGYPSAANDLGGLWAMAKSLSPILSSVYKAAKPALSMGLSTLPGGGLMNQVLDAVENHVSGSSKKITPARKKAVVTVSSPPKGTRKAKRKNA